MTLFVLSAETTARIDDYIRFQIPLDDESSLEEALKISDHGIVRGRPNGRYQRWKLNEYGFRSKSTNFQASNKPRIMILGASESFGMYESQGNSYAELLEKKHGNDFDFINASIIGMPASAMKSYWDQWLIQFKPNVVIILANPLFYLSDIPPAATQTIDTTTKEVSHHRTFKSRFLERIKNHLSTPATLLSLRQEAKIRETIDSKPAEWFFNNAPEDRIALYKTHVGTLVDRIASSGAKIILMTQPLSTQYPARAEDYTDFLAARELRPRASAQSIWEFSQSCREFLNQLGNSDGIETIDLWTQMTGKKTYFADIVHFSNAGSQVVADEISSFLPRLTPLR